MTAPTTLSPQRIPKDIQNIVDLTRKITKNSLITAVAAVFLKDQTGWGNIEPSQLASSIMLSSGAVTILLDDKTSTKGKLHCLAVLGITFASLNALGLYGCSPS